MPRYPIFIVGSPRSGTSILVDALLAVDFHGFREGNLLGLLNVFNLAIDRHFKTFGARNDMVLAGVVDPGELRQRIGRAMRATMEQYNPQPPWFDKSGNSDIIRAVPAIRALWPECGFIFAKRRGIENIVSRCTKFPEHSFEYHAMDWAANMAAWRQVKPGLPADCFEEVDQQDMIQSPEAVAGRLATLLGLAPALAARIVGVLQRNRPQATSSQSANRVLALEATGWSDVQTQSFLKHCTGEMEAFGYTLNTDYRRAGAA